MSGKNSIQVAIKVRPLFRKEKDQQFSWRIVDNSIQSVDSQSEPYYFDHIFDQDVTNQIIFDKMAKQIVHSAIQGFNGTIFAYGQTSSGKTYTMMGDDDNPGVMVLAVKEIFKEIERTQDRQFLLRVGYIEIYNERIYDLLNKKNQDLKIHETSTGIVSVNCEECIIRSEDDLLNHLNKGNKERTVGETNMNERSSRSHAIFRIIIESRKMERTEDDAVIQSVINLVDLAGSERADQTGARGTRLKEGGHINKSLLFLSNVIKRLSENEEDKYISFRDSKLTRILQASLGGNALTAIICTIKPNAVEETQSTLSFAVRAKAIKNKPQVNEIVSDATMMKRLEHEIKVLKNRLEEEQRKNESQIKVRQLEQRIKDEDLKIISCNSLHSIRNREKRRRTWCPSSTNLDAGALSQQPSALPIPSTGSNFLSALPHTSRLQAPKTSYYNTPLITMRPQIEPPSTPKFTAGLPIPPDNLPEIDEEFAPAEMVNFEMLPPLHTPPHIQQLQRNFSITPKLAACPRSTLEKVERDLMELQSFTNLENKAEVQHEPDLALKQKVETLSQRNTVLENERLEYLQLKDEIVITSEKFTETQKRCDELQIQLSKLNNANKKANEKITKYEADLAKLKKTNEKLEMENREAVNLEFEFQRHKNKSKLRENELLEALNDKEKEITKLEKSLNNLSAERLQNSKEELLQKSLNEGGEANLDGNVCIKCEDLQRLLEENKKVTLEFEKLTLEYEKLKLSYIEIEKENDTNKLKIVQLEELQVKEKAECEKLLLDVQNLREKLHNVQQDYQQLSTENSSKHAECMALNRQVEVAREEMVVLEENFIKLELSWQEQQQTITDIESQYATIQNKYEQLQNQYEQLQANRGQSLTDCQRLEKDNVDLQIEIEDLKKKVQDAQQRLLESNEKYEETAKESKTASEEYTAETSKIHQDNEQLKQQLLEIQTQFEDLQKEYDDLSNQLMDHLQDNESLKNENTKLQEKLKEYKEKNQEVCSAEAKIHELKSQLEKVLSGERKNLLKTPSPCQNSSMRSSGVCVEEEDDFESQDLQRKFCELSESLTEIELEHTKGKTKVFKSVSKNSTPTNYKMYLKNILGVRKSQKEFDMEIENIHLQGSFKQHSFHIVELSDKEEMSSEMECDTSDTNGCENMSEYIEKLKQEIVQLKTTYEQERLSNKSLLESTERAFSEMREQITQLSTELMEKSIFVENCACKTYQQQIETLEKEKADITIVCEELQEKVNCTLNGSFNMLMNTTVPGAAVKAVADDKLKELEQLKLREQELLESFDSQTKTLEELTQRHLDIEVDLETARQQLENQEKEYKEKYNHLQLEILQKLELSASEYRDNMKKYNKEWEERREEYEQTIKDLQQQIEQLKHQQSEISSEDLKTEIKQESISDPQEEVHFEENLEVYNKAELEETPANYLHMETPEDIEAIKQDKCKLEEDKQNLQQQLNSAEEQLENLKEENRIQYEEITLLDAKIVSLEELLSDAKLLHTTMVKENSLLETQIKDLEEDLNCIPPLHERNQQLSDEVEKLNLEYSQIQDNLQKAEMQIQEFAKEDFKREELIQTLQFKLNQLTAMEEEKINLANEFENQKQEYTQVQEKLNKTEEQKQEFCSEDTNREELIQALQSKLSNMAAGEEEMKTLENECTQLKETVKGLQDKEVVTSNEIDVLKQQITTCNENLSELVNSQSQLQLEKCALEEKLQQIKAEYSVLETDHVLLETQLSELTDERKSLNEQCSLLQEEKTNREELIQELQIKLSNMTAVEEEKKTLENECILLKEIVKGLQDKEVVTSNEIDALKQQINTCNENLSELVNSQSQLQLEKCALEEKLQQIKAEYSVLKTDHVLLETQLSELTDERKSLNEQCSLLQEEKTNREELIQALNIKLSNMKAVEEEKKTLENEYILLKENVKGVQDKEIITSNEIDALKQQINTCNENLSELVNSQSQLQLEKCAVEEKLHQLTAEYSLLKTNHVLMKNQLSELTEESRSLNKQCSVLQEEKTTLEEQLKCLKEKEKAEELLEQMIKEKGELAQNLRLTTEKLESAQNQLEEKVNEISKAKLEKTQIQQELQSLKESILKEIEEKRQQLEESEREKEKTTQDNVKFYQDLQALKQNFTKAIEENREQQQELVNFQQENSHLKKDLANAKDQLTKLDQETQQQNVNLERAHSERSSLQQDLETVKESLSKAMEEKQQQFNNLENNYQTVQQLNQELQQQLQEKIQLQHELQATNESFTKLQDEQQQLQKTLLNYQKLKEDKNNLEATLKIIKSAQSGALKNLQEERDQLHRTLQQYEQQNTEYKEKQETLQQKIESMSQQLHEVRGKAQSYEKLLQEQEEVENALSSATATNQKLQQEITELTSQQETYSSMIENLSGEIEKLNLQLDKQHNEKEMLQTKLSHLKDKLQGEQSSLQRDNHDLKSSLEELKLKCDSLQTTNTQLRQLNNQLDQQLKGALETLKDFNAVQEELNTLKVQHSELQHNMKATVEEAGRCSLALREDIEHHKQLLQKQMESFNKLKVEMETKQKTLTDKIVKLSKNIETLRSEKRTLEDKMREITVRNFEQDLQRQAIDATANTSTDSNTSYSPKGRRSLERMGVSADFKANVNIEEKLNAIQQKNSTIVERRNRRLSTHDERRRQSYWGVAHDKETMTAPVDNSCNCIELDRKLKECERNLFIKNSQVTALSMELKNHPLKEENATLKKRLQEEQDRHCIEIKRCKNKLYEQTAKAEKATAAAAHATAKTQHVVANAALAAEQQNITPVLPKVVADVEIQTDDDLSACIQKLQGKYNNLKNICRYRSNVIKELEEKMTQKENSDVNSLSALDTAQLKVLNNQCESLKKELKAVKEKYENAKKVLNSRRVEIIKLRAQLEQTQ